MESKYNLLTKLLKNLKNIVTPDGGIKGGGVLVVNGTFTEETASLDKTWQEIADAKIVYITVHAEEEGSFNDDYITVSQIGFNLVNGYYVRVGDALFTTDNPDGYPVMTRADDPIGNCC